MNHPTATQATPASAVETQFMQEQRVWPLLVLQTLMRGAMTGSADWSDHGTNIHLPPPV